MVDLLSESLKYTRAGHVCLDLRRVQEISLIALWLLLEVVENVHYEVKAC